MSPRFPQEPLDDDARDGFRSGFDDEAATVQAIRRHLLTEEQWRGLYERGLSVEMVLNGGWTGDQEEFVFALLREWNRMLGFTGFIES